MVTLYDSLKKGIRFFLYRFRYLINYIIIGFLSILLELILISYVLPPIINQTFKIVIGFSTALIFAFFLNARLNFKVPKKQNTKTFILFSVISIFAFLLNLALINLLKGFFVLSYSYSRLITASLVFIISYTLHRKITFINFVNKIGIAVYLKENENIAGVYSKIRYYADFIHIDLIDKSFNENAGNIDLSLMKEIKKTWGLEKMLHIMSKYPSRWVDKLADHVGVIILHPGISEPLGSVIDNVLKRKKKVGIALKDKQELEKIINYLPKLNFIQVMGIKKLGESGQPFDISSLALLKEINKLKKDYRFEVIFDGGVKPTNINKIKARYIVSSSGLILSKNPINSFLELKTGSRYKPTEEELRLDLIEKIKEKINLMPFIESGSIVGSFSENKDLKEISDVDVIIICDSLNKRKFYTIINNFNEKNLT